MMRAALLLAAVAALSAGAEEARVRAGGTTELLDAKVRFVPTAFHPGWISRAANGGWRPEPDASRTWTIAAKDPSEKPVLSGRTGWSVAADGSLDVTCSFKGLRPARLLSLAVAGSLPNEEYAGGTMTADGRDVAIPAEQGKGAGVFNGSVTNLAFRDAKGVRRFALAFPGPTKVLFQDNRVWHGKAFALRLQLPASDISADFARTMRFKVVADGPIRCETAAYKVAAGPDWIPMEECFAVEPGSALDFSGIGGTGKPAGKYGYPVVRGGHFEFERLPGRPQRFYGVNLVAGANFPEEKYAKPFAENLARLGYNAVRMHHHDQGLSGGGDGVLDAVNIARFDALIAALVENGLYVTTDLYVSRRARYRDCGIDREGRIEQIGEYKRLALFHEGTFQNYLRHARALLAHVNPHTGRRYADEPAFGWISFINEGTLGAGDTELFVKYAEFVLPKWRAWLAAKQAADPAYAGIPATLPKAPRDLRGDGFAHKNAFLLFLADVEREFARRVTRFLREEMGCRALTTDMNYSFKPAGYQKLITEEYDYMDDHFYVDHPHFLERKWALPSELPNANTFQRRTCGAIFPTTRRIFGRPFVITEYNYSGPGQYRGVGGIATGAMAALQDWDGLWRFAWSHGDAGVRGPKAMTYFDMSGDPLGLASERASMCLFLRRDVTPYENAFAYFIDRRTADALSVPQRETPTDWRATGWWARVGCVVGETVPPGLTVVGAAAKDDRVEDAPARPKDLVRPIAVDPDAGSFTIDTPRTAGGFAEGGEIRAGGFAARIDGTATVWASSLDGAPIGESGRLLVTHLTDVQNSGISYADSSRRILLDWGAMPHLMHAGTARVSIRLASGAWTVYALSPSGRRRGGIPSEYRDGRLGFTADVAREPSRATYLYELVRGH